MPKPKIVFSISNFALGGTQRQLVRLLPHLLDEYDVHLFILKDSAGRKTVTSEIPAGVTIHQFNYDGYLTVPEWRKLYIALRAIKPSLVISSLFFSNFVIRILCIFQRLPVVTREHNTDSGLGVLHRLVDRVLAKKSKTIVAVSQEVADSVSKNVGIVKEKFTVIHNGINLAEVDERSQICNQEELKRELGIDSKHKIALAVGRLVSQKRLDLLIEGFALFARERLDWRLVIVGGGSQLTTLESLVDTLHITNQVIFTGEKKQVDCYYEIADCLVSTSEKEGMSNVHLEALAHGLPILTTNTGGVSALVIQDKTGLLIDDVDPEAISNTLEVFTNMSVRAMREASMEHRDNFAIEETAHQYKKLLNSIITH